MGRRNLAAEYERLYPNTGCGDAQKTERMERILFKEDRSTHRRTHRTRGIIVPALPWTQDKGTADVAS